MYKLPSEYKILRCYYGQEPPTVTGFKILHQDEYTLSAQWTEERRGKQVHHEIKVLLGEELKMLWHNERS